MAVLGNFMGLYIDGERVALATSNSISINTETVDISTFDSQNYEEVQPTLRTLSGSIDGIVTPKLKNLLAFPEDFTQAIWLKDGGVTIDRDIARANGQLLAQRINLGGSGGTTVSQVLPGTSSVGTWFTGYAVVRGVVGQDISLTVGDDSSSDIAQVASQGLNVRQVLKVSFQAISGIDVRIDLQSDPTFQFIVEEVMLVEGEDANLPYAGSTYTAQRITDAANNKDKVVIKYTSDLDDDIQITCDAYINDVSFTGANNDVLKFSASIQATGNIALTQR